jgi:hypothetical protein
VDAHGNLFIADYGNHRVRKVTLDGIITTVAGTGTAGFSGDGGKATDARLSGPVELVVVGGRGWHDRCCGLDQPRVGTQD